MNVWRAYLETEIRSLLLERSMQAQDPEYLFLKCVVDYIKMGRYFLFLLGCLGALPAVALTALAVFTPITVSGGTYLLGSWLFLGGLLCAPWWRKYFWGPVLAGAVVILLMASLRVYVVQNQARSLPLVLLPSGTATRTLNWLVEEQDIILFGQEIMYLLGGVTPREHANLVPALSVAFRQAAVTRGVGASPFMSTFLGLENPGGFDAVVIEPEVPRTALLGVVFLHGFMGNVSIQCWEIAQATRDLGAVTVCPSTTWLGDWWEPAGQATLQATIAYLRARGIHRLYVGGFSNGGNGTCRLMPALEREPGLQGLFFIAGVCGDAHARDATLPLLVIQGRQDERMSVAAARNFVRGGSPLTRYIEMDADHFLIMKQPRAVQMVLGGWLRDTNLHQVYNPGNRMFQGRTR